MKNFIIDRIHSRRHGSMSGSPRMDRSLNDFILGDSCIKKGLID